MFAPVVVEFLSRVLSNLSFVLSAKPYIVSTQKWKKTAKSDTSWILFLKKYDNWSNK